MEREFASDKFSSDIYVVVTKTRTKVSKLIRLLSRQPYSHASIAFDRELNEMYSFARRSRRNIFNSGFIKEKIDAGILGSDDRITCCVFCLPLTVEELERIRKEIEICKRRPWEYNYNYIGLVGAGINHPYNRPKRFFCSQYVAWLFQQAGLVFFHKDCALVRPEDIRQAFQNYMIYEGRLCDYRGFLKSGHLYQAREMQEQMNTQQAG